MEKKEIIQQMHDILNCRGFIRKGNAFLRIQGDGIVQSISLHKEGRGSLSALYIQGAVHSLDCPEVFGTPNDLYLPLQIPFFMKLFEGCDVPGNYYDESVSRVTRILEEVPMLKQIENLETKCVPTLDTILSQDEYYHFMLWRDKREYGSIHETNPEYIYPLLRLKCYLEAEGYCDRKLELTELAFQSNCRIWKPDQISQMRDWYDERHRSTKLIKHLLQEKRYEEIELYLDENRKQNIEIYLSVMKKAGVKQLEKAGL